MRRYIKQELMIGVYSKSYLMIGIFLLALFGIILFMNYNSVTDTYESYKHTESYYQKNGLDINKDLSGETKSEVKGDSELITNPILYHKNMLSKYIYAASPKYTLSQLLESSILFFPLVFGILGLMAGTNDFKYKTIKLKTVRMNKLTFSIAKQLSIMIITFLILVASLLIAYIIGCVLFQKLCTVVPVSEFKMQNANENSTILIKFALGYIIALIFAEIGYSLGVVFKNIFVGLISIVIYMFVLPNLGKFDLKNSLFFVSKKIFNYYGVVNVQAPKDTSILIACLVLAGVPIIFCFMNLFFITKRSSFES